MTIDPDPYRTLGLARGASIDEIKRAYRRLAKIHHPDAAGEKNVPRFLAIQAAYEQLAGGADGGGTPRGPAGAPKSWEADPVRSDATRRAYGGRARWSAPGSSGAGGPAAGGGSAGRASAGAAGSGGPDSQSKAGPRPRPGPTRSGRRGMGGSGTGTGGGTRAGAGAGGATAGSGTDAGTAGPTPRGAGARKRNKATLGSTSYDGVEGPFEPDWRGASWYGTTSGTYWTLNPKEYADPRKHGPEYQARARRATRPVEGPGAPSPDEADRSDPAAPEPQASAPPDTDPQPAARPTHTTSSWWESTTGTTGPEPAPSAGAASMGAASSRADDAARAASASPPPPDLGRAFSEIGRTLTDPTFGGGRGRLARAFLGWLPIAFGVSWLVGEITGCGRFAATCNGLADPIVLALQVGALLALLALPVIASIAAMGALTLLAAAVSAAFVLSATGEAADSDSRRVALGAVLLISWSAGIGIAIARRVRAPTSTTRPVS